MSNYSFISMTHPWEKGFLSYRNYGHFIRDTALWIFYYLDKTKILYEPDHKLMVLAHPLTRSGSFIRMSPTHKEMLEKLFNAEVYDTKKTRWDEMRRTVRSDRTEYIRWAQKRTDHKISENNYYNLNAGLRRRVGTITRHGDDWGGDTAPYPKISIDKFRDYCFKIYNIVPQLKKRLLYVPREECTTRFLKDERLENVLQTFCERHGYEFVRWANSEEVSIEEQMIAYSESEIIVGSNGTDFVNSYWANEKQLIIEIICTDRIATAGGFSGFAAAFRSDDISKQLLKVYGEHYPRNNGNQYRNWHIIQTPHENSHVVEGHQCIKWYRHLCKIWFETSDENRQKIQDVMSRWAESPSTSIS